MPFKKVDGSIHEDTEKGGDHAMSEIPLEAITTTDPNPPPVSPIAEMVKDTVVSLKAMRAVEAGEKPAPEPKTKAEPVVEAKTAVEPDLIVDEPETETLPTAEASEAGKQLAKKRKSLQDRINELTSERHASRMEAEEAKLERDALKRRLEAIEKPATETKPKTEDAEPAPDQFEDYESYVKAQARWEARQELTAALSARDRAAADRRGQQDFQTAVAKHAERVIAAQAKYADYDAVIAKGNAALTQAGAIVPPAMIKAIVESDRSADILYDLASHPDVCLDVVRRSAGSTLDAAPVVRLYLESRLTPVQSGPDVQPKPVTKAAAPIKPVGTASVASPTAADLVKGTTMSLKQFRHAEGRQ